MAIITTDVLIKGKRRDAIFNWLGDIENHVLIFEDAFSSVQRKGDTELELGYGPAFRQRTLVYIFDGKDDGHGGRRINIKTEGKRTTGHLSYSLRTMKPATNTLVTIHWDYNTGGLLGQAINSKLVREELYNRFQNALEQLKIHLSKTQ